MNLGAIQVISALLFGLMIMGVSIYRLWKPSEKCQQHKVTLPFGVQFEGCSVWGAIFFGGLFIFAIGSGFNLQGEDNYDNSEVKSTGFLIQSAFAQAPTSLCTKSASGWVYTGTGSYSKKWWFEIVKGEVPNSLGLVTTQLILRAETNRYLREHHYSTLAGTFIGDMLGVQIPKQRCTISKNKKVKVKEFVSIGKSRIWARVEVL